MIKMGTPKPLVTCAPPSFPPKSLLLTCPPPSSPPKSLPTPPPPRQPPPTPPKKKRRRPPCRLRRHVLRKPAVSPPHRAVQQPWAAELFASSQMARGQNSVPPVNIPIPTKIDSNGCCTYPKMVPLVLTHSQMSDRQRERLESRP